MSASRIDLEARLRELSLLDGMSEGGRAIILQHAEPRLADSGERVAPPDEAGVLALVAGRLQVRRSDDGRQIAELPAGTILAAISALEREVELRALEECEVLRLASEGVNHLTAVDPNGFAMLARRVAESERALQVGIHLSRFFPRLEQEGLEAFGGEVEWVALRGGEWLFREGDAGDAAYIVISGRLRAVTGGDAEERVLNELSAGETVGEMALLTDDVRSACVYAVRDSQLVRLSRAVFDRLTDQYPEALRRIAGFVVDRLRRHEAGAAPRSGLATITLVGSRRGLELRGITLLLARALSEIGRVDVLDRAGVESALGRPGIADAGDEEAAGIRLVHWLREREAASHHVLYVADPDWTPWTERALRQADHVLVVGRFEDGPELGDMETHFDEVWKTSHPPQRSLVLLRPAAAGRPHGTARWLRQRSVDRHFHARDDNLADAGRLARLLTGHGIGLVLGGGGARGFAHVGVLRTLEEAGVTIDFLGGTSMGAFVSGLFALGHDAAECQAIMRRNFSGLLDVTLPLVSLVAGRRIESNLESVFGDIEIEDLVTPFFCVATNLSQAEAVVHQQGSLKRAIRSSVSLPGILPPVPIGGDLYVDGGLIDNLPIESMVRLCGGGPVIAIDVSPEEDLRAGPDLITALSGWRVLWQRINPFGSALDVPYMSSVLMRSVVVGSLLDQRERRGADLASLYLKMPVEEWGLLEFDKVDPVVARGYEASADSIRTWWSEQKARCEKRRASPA